MPCCREECATMPGAAAAARCTCRAPASSTSARYCCGNRPRTSSAPAGLRRLRDEGDVVAQVAQALDQPGRGAPARDLVEVALAEVVEGFAGGQQVERGDEQLVGDGHQRPHRAAAGAEAVVLVAGVAALGPQDRKSVV